MKSTYSNPQQKRTIYNPFYHLFCIRFYGGPQQWRPLGFSCEEHESVGPLG